MDYFELTKWCLLSGQKVESVEDVQCKSVKMMRRWKVLVKTGGWKVPRHRAGEKRYRSGKDHLEQIDCCPDIKFGSFTIVAVPARLQRCGGRWGGGGCE